MRSSPAFVDDDPSYPEGGREAWSVVFGSFCAQMCVFGVINTSAVFQLYFAENQLRMYDASAIGWIFSLYLFLVYFVGMQVGPLFDQYGPRLLVGCGCILLALSMFLLGFCSAYYQIMLDFSVLGGLGGALINSPSLGAVAHFFHARRGLATGLSTTAGGIGGVVFPLLLRSLLPRIGFAWATRVVGFIVLGLAVPATLLVRSRLPPRARDTAALWPDFSMFRNAKFALLCLSIFFIEYGVLIPLAYIVSYAASFDQNTETSYVLPALLNAGSTAGRVIPGLLADKMGRFNVLILSVGLSEATLAWCRCA
ncbi:hypothetical protein Sste5346_006391 [Sporothrix stenoceras]|uniref:Major facilitator superfamily (MFS) profile domain-containing protein n=1 Tax=Sporothrix stenoceras TaxID=5173 RepID=A0ABR3Z050_9PEZI